MEIALSSLQVWKSTICLDDVPVEVAAYPSRDVYRVLFNDGRVVGEGDEVVGQRPFRIGIRLGDVGPVVETAIGGPDAAVVNTVSDDLNSSVDVAEKDAAQPIAVRQ